jgi:hypothetical protein
VWASQRYHKNGISDKLIFRIINYIKNIRWHPIRLRIQRSEFRILSGTLEFIARVTSHIPDKGQVTLRYYGLYANPTEERSRRRAMRLSLSGWWRTCGLSLPGAGPSRKGISSKQSAGNLSDLSSQRKRK